MYIDSEANTRLTLSGAMDDSYNPIVPATALPGVPTLPVGTGLAKVGIGELALGQGQGATSTYRGITSVNQGYLIVQNSTALGAGALSDVQKFTVTGGNLGDTYTLTFNGATTTPLPFNAIAVQIQVALNALTTISGTVGGSVSVTGPVNGAFTVTFLGNLAGFQQSLLTATPSGSVVVSPATQVTAGTGGTIVANGASVEEQGSVETPAENIIIQGQGVTTVAPPSNPGNFQPSWLPQGPAPINNGQTPGAGSPVSGRITGVMVDPNDSNVIYISAAGGGAWKTNNGGITWLPLEDSVPGATGTDATGGNPTYGPVPVNDMFGGAIAVRLGPAHRVFRLRRAEQQRRFLLRRGHLQIDRLRQDVDPVPGPRKSPGVCRHPDQQDRRGPHRSQRDLRDRGRRGAPLTGCRATAASGWVTPARPAARAANGPT